MKKHARRPSSRQPVCLQLLEARTMLSATTVGVYAGFPNASETNPTTTGLGQFLFKRPTGSTTSPLTVSYYLNHASTATSGSDFQPLSGTAIIPAGKRTVAVNLIPIDDNIHEDTETVVVSVSDNANYTVVHRSATVSIADNDPETDATVGVYAGFPNASETNPTTTGKGQYLFKRLTGDTSDPLSIDYYINSNSTATSGVDFTALSGTAVIPAGKRTVAVDLFPIDDNNVEGDETVIVSVKDGDYTVVHRSATVTIADNDTSPSSWFGDTRRYVTPVDIASGSFARTDQPVDVGVNFSNVLSTLSTSGSLIDNSIKVVEVSADGTTAIDSNVPFQFDHNAGFNASTNAAGDLVILVKGNTAASTTRHYQVYFDTTGSFSAPSFSSLVTTTDNVADAGATDGAVKVQTQTATYTYQKDEGGFSHITDANDADWISWSSTPNAGGENRGLPNLGALGFHPGRDHDVTTQIVSSGPLKTTLLSTDGEGNQVMYEFYPKFVRFTVLVAHETYFALYEGTPGGGVDANDSIYRSDGTHTGIFQNWDEPNGLGSSNGEEWAYFNDSGDGSNGTSLYYVHNSTDSLEDSYFEYNAGGDMTVFGFGRTLPDINNTSQGVVPVMTATPNVFTFGLTDGGSDFNATKTTIDGVYHDVSSNLGAPSTKPS